jgi:hypothetical protein
MCIQKKYRQFPLPQQGKRMRCVLFSFFVLIGTANLHSLENNGRGTKAIGMANAFVAVADNLWAVEYNPAGLTQVTDIQGSAFIIPSQFGVPELRTTAFAAAVPFSFATVALDVEKYGFDLYKETEIGMAFGLKLDRNISGGISLNLHRLDIAHYGSSQNVVFNGGILATALKDVKIGFNLNNIMGATIGSLGEKLPQLFSFGTCWSPVYNLLLSLEMEKDIRYPVSLKCGIEQIVFDVLAFHAGVANNPEKYSAGITLHYSIFEFGYAGYSHPDLGWTHQIEIAFKLDQE